MKGSDGFVFVSLFLEAKKLQRLFFFFELCVILFSFSRVSKFFLLVSGFMLFVGGFQFCELWVIF